LRGFRRRKTKREKPFRRGAVVRAIKEKPKRKKRLPWFTRGGKHVPITPPIARPIMVQRRKELTPMDLLKVATRQLGPLGINLAKGIDVASKQTAPLLRGLGTKGLVPIGAGLRQIEREILQQRPIGIPQIIDKQDVISTGSENELQGYVKDALRAMPVGTDTSVEPKVNVVPRDQFHAMTRHASPATTTGRNNMMVSDELFDLTPKQRRGMIAHETWHALKHFDVYGRYVGPPPQWAEQEAGQFERQVEPEGSRQNAQQFAHLRQQQGAPMGGIPSLFGR